MSDIKPYERRCKNWLLSFRDYALPRCTAPENWIFWSGLWTLSAALRRRVSIGRKYLGGWTCYPHMYLMFVGPPGTRKNTTMGFAINLIDQIPALTRPPTFVTQAALVDSIVKSPDSSVYLTVEEFGDLIIKGGLEMFEFLTSMYDGKKQLDQKTMSRGIEFAERPCLNLFAGTTPEWIAGNMPASVIGGGLASRFIFIYNETERMRKIYFDDVVGDFTKMENDLVADLSHIANNIEGEFTIDDEAKKWAIAWNEEYDKKPINPKIQGYYRRKPTHLHKVAQLVHIAYSDELVLHKADFELALAALDAVEPTLLKVFQGVGRNEYALDMKDIAEYVKAKGRVPEDVLKRHFQSVAQPGKLQELIDGLLGFGMIRSELDKELGNRRVFLPSDITE